MPHWLIKSAAQRAISWLPGRHRWNELFQKHVTHSIDLTAQRFEARLEYARRHLDNFLELRPHRADRFRVCELGTGWFPVVPISLLLCGAGEVCSYDIAPLLSGSRLRDTFEKFGDYERSGALARFLPRLRPERWKRMREVAATAGQAPPEAVLEQLDIRVRVRDARDTGLPPGTIDLFVSTGVLEYIPVPELKAILAEFKRLGSRDAVQSHYLNLVDQYSYFDPSITPFNFLKFPSRRWKYLNSPLTWLNRLRISDYRQLFAEAGYRVTRENNTSGSAEDLRKIRLAPEFQHYKQEDLLVLISWLTAAPVDTLKAE